MNAARTAIAGRRDQGFTLLEILVALAVLGLLMASLVQGLRAGVSAWTTQTERLTKNADLDATDRTLRTLIGRLEPGGVSGRPAVFKGTEHSLTFTTSIPDPAGVAMNQVVDVLLAVDEAHRLQMVLLPHYRDPTGVPPAPGRVLLLRDVDRLELGYWQDSQSGWQPEWRGIVVPKLIRIRVVSNPGSGRTTPDIVVSPMRDRWQL
jgi:prepilin-type N-terminal cleavage/methylation domain-containing protein